MIRKSPGYTIVELITIIIVLGLLIAIGIVSWSSYIGWSEDRSRESSAQQWASVFDLYKSKYFAYPIMPTNSSTPAVVCLGNVGSFPTATANTGGDRCGQFKTTGASTSATTSSTFIAEAQKVGAIPKNPHEDSGKTIFDNTLVGPLAHVTRSGNSGTVTVTARIVIFMRDACPTSNGFITAAAADLPGIASLKPGAGSPGSTANVCYLERQFTTTL